jgi:crossover junction endodeoxyribonuclease RusA
MLLIEAERARAGKTAAAPPSSKARSSKARSSKGWPSPQPIDDIAGFGLAEVAAGQRVILPFPPADLNPNARGHWSKKSRAAKTYRRECWVLALAAKLTAPKDGPIRLHLDFFPPDRQSRDDDNAIASFKAGRDGIADALKADDSRFVTSHSWHTEPRSCVVVTFLDGVTIPQGGTA